MLSNPFETEEFFNALARSELTINTVTEWRFYSVKPYTRKYNDNLRSGRNDDGPRLGRWSRSATHKDVCTDGR